jgi:hypothetical protein
MARADVETYLHAKNIAYNAVQLGGGEGWTYAIKVGEEPGSLICNRWNVYVALEFSSADALNEVHIRKIGKCL